MKQEFARGKKSQCGRGDGGDRDMEAVLPFDTRLNQNLPAFLSFHTACKAGPQRRSLRNCHSYGMLRLPSNAFPFRTVRL